TQLIILAGVKDANKVSAGLKKTQVITLKEIVITLTSSSQDTLRDTIAAGDGPGTAFLSSATVDQQLVLSYPVKPLRHWSIVVKTLDLNDSIVHYDSTMAANLLLGETRPVTLNLSSRFVMYETKFSVPDSL